MASFPSRWDPYVPVSARRANAAREVKHLRKQGREAQPVVIDGRTIARSFWGRSWCDNLEAYADYANRLPRGRTYVRNGSVFDLMIGPGCVESHVSGSSVYRICIGIAPLATPRWRKLVGRCSGHVASLVDLLQGRFSDGVMRTLVDPKGGLFPRPAEITMHCSCPDGAWMCKHVAATLYGVGARLDHQPELFFLLRQVDGGDLIAAAEAATELADAKVASANALGDADLSAVFGIEMDVAPPASPPSRIATRTKSVRQSRKRR